MNINFTFNKEPILVKEYVCTAYETCFLGHSGRADERGARKGPEQQRGVRGGPASLVLLRLSPKGLQGPLLEELVPEGAQHSLRPTGRVMGRLGRSKGPGAEARGVLM